MKDRRSESVEEYLEALFKIERRDGAVAIGRLASELGVSAASASQMAGRLTDAGLTFRDSEGLVRLSEDGAREAARLVRRHRLSERLLVDVLGLPWDQVHDEACRFEHALSPEVERRLAERLGNPSTCPHGHAIPDEAGVVSETPSVPLAELQAGDAAVVERVSEDDPDLLRYLASLGLVPQTTVVVHSVAPFGGPHLIGVGDAQYALGREVACRVFVRRAA